MSEYIHMLSYSDSFVLQKNPAMHLPDCLFDIWEVQVVQQLRTQKIESEN